MEQLHIQAGGGPGGQSGASQPGQDGGPDGLTVDIAIFDVGGQGGGGSGEKVEQVDALGQILGHPGEGGHIDEQQGAAADSEAGEHAGDGAGQEGDGPRHQKNSALTPP